jgi:hypothetical protein
MEDDFELRILGGISRNGATSTKKILL